MVGETHPIGMQDLMMHGILLECRQQGIDVSGMHLRFSTTLVFAANKIHRCLEV
jgi:hypothetical protein